MRKRFTTIILFLLPFCCFGQTGVLVIKDAAIIDVINNKIIKDRIVVIEGNKIIAVDKKANIPAQATIINAKGKYLFTFMFHLLCKSQNALQNPVSAGPLACNNPLQKTQNSKKQCATNFLASIFL